MEQGDNFNGKKRNPDEDLANIKTEKKGKNKKDRKKKDKKGGDKNEGQNKWVDKPNQNINYKSDLKSPKFEAYYRVFFHFHIVDTTWSIF